MIICTTTRRSYFSGWNDSARRAEVEKDDHVLGGTVVWAGELREMH